MYIIAGRYHYFCTVLIRAKQFCAYFDFHFVCCNCFKLTLDTLLSKYLSRDGIHMP